MRKYARLILFSVVMLGVVGGLTYTTLRADRPPDDPWPGGGPAEYADPHDDPWPGGGP